VTPRRAATLAALTVVTATAGTAATIRAEPLAAVPTVAVAPLTGRPDPTGFAHRRAALAVKIENTPDARPQAGLDTADVVYEEQVEGGITRFWAVFNSVSPGDIGPIRSVRAMDPTIVTPLGGVAAFSGGTLGNETLIRQAPVTWVDQTNAGPAFYRTSTRAAPHNLYAHAALLWERPARPVPPPPLFHYRDAVPSHLGTPATTVTLGFASPYNVTYRYQAQTHTWLRAYGTTPHRAASGRPLAPTNVIIQFVTYGSGGDAQLLGDAPDQRAWVLRDGTLITGQWAKPDAATPTQFTDPSGAPIALRPGPTWVELLPAGAPVRVTTTPR
jgi:Protein of unknown function (DUF3048) N-terminal domain/Protein of unknown function (DUF3048) C-terminal domain